MVKRTRHKIGFDTASSRLGPERLRIALGAFERLVPEKASMWDFATFSLFFESTLPAVPSLKMDMTRLFFEAFAPYGTLSFKDFIVSLCVLAQGLPEERLRFAFDIFDDGRSEISRDSMRLWIKTLGGSAGEVDFEGRLDLSGWMRWSSSRLDSCVVKWVFNITDQFDLLRCKTVEVIEDGDSDEETKYLQLAKTTSLHTFEVYGIAMAFKRIKASRPTETMDFEGFCTAIPSIQDDALRREIFGDRDCLSLEDFSEVICQLWRQQPALELGIRVDLELRPHSVEEEIRICSQELDTPQGPGDYAVLDLQWFTEWRSKQCCRAIDNTALLADLTRRGKEKRRRQLDASDETVLGPEPLVSERASGAVEPQDEESHTVVSVPVYKALQLWYGGGPGIIRRTRESTLPDGKRKWLMDLYPLQIRCALTSAVDDVREICVYDNEQVLDCACAEFGLSLAYAASVPCSPRQGSPLGSARGELLDDDVRAKAKKVKDGKGGATSSTSGVQRPKANYRLWISVTHHKRVGSFDPLTLFRPRTSSDVSKQPERVLSVDCSGKSRWKEWNPGDPRLSDNQLFLLANSDWEPPDQRKGAFFRAQPRGGFFGGKAQTPVKDDAEKSTAEDASEDAIHPNSTRGLCGLNNLGNTCYMNSALQCLSQTRMLREYFLSESFLRDINNDSTWGMQGRLAVEFYDLLKMLWTSTGSVAPTEFYKTISVFQNRFADNTQEDPQEFLALFLQGLSEDVCRIQEKPYIEIKDSGDRDDREVAEEYWNALMKRELSIVSVLFMGQFKSVLSCRSCEHKNVTFDPFSSIALALSEESRTVVLSKLRLFADGRWKWLRVELPERSTIDDLRVNVADLTGRDQWVFSRDSEQLKPLRDDQALVRLHLVPIVGFAVTSRDGPLCCLVHRRIEKMNRYYISQMQRAEFGQPLIVQLSPDDPFPEIWKMVRYMAPECASNTRIYTLASVLPNNHAACSLCSWTTGCTGCIAAVPLNLVTDKHGNLPTFALDWDGNLQRYYNEKNISYEVELQGLSRGTMQLEHMIESFLREETIEASCEKCDGKQCGKKMGVWGFPPYLMIQLKRFKDFGNRKHKGMVYFTTGELDLTPYVERNAGHTENAQPRSMSFTNGQYDLYGIINHEGEMNHGHCTACVKIDHPGEPQWLQFSDSHVTPIEAAAVVTNLAYILFFVRRDISKLSVEEMFAMDPNKEAADANFVRCKPAVPPQRRAACSIM